MSHRQLDEEAIFHIARELDEPAKRDAYLDQVCGGDRNLRERVEALLSVHELDEHFLQTGNREEPTVDHPAATFPAQGQQIGRYKLLQQIGEGGFGVVYMAEQSEPIRRKVALKVIKPGMDTAAVVARFEAERQALAMMDHINIARVLDGGATDGGRPYFVMELVKGVPVTEYCDKNHLPTEERLKLFMSVCHAVQHAHQKGIIHRDLKPSNVLVTLADGQPIVKVIDFGVAKAINQQLTERTLFTAYGQMVGTPQYMSPEQAEMSCLDVDTRSDVYSLGVLLYELLTGTTPLERERLRTAGYAELQRLIREDEPPRPSTRLSTSGKQLTVLAKHRSVTPEKLKHQVKGDLDWVVMKALAKERRHRYQSPNTLAEDLQRYLNNDPIEARPPSLSYRTRKFVRRHRSAVGALALVLLALVLTAIGTTIGMVQALKSDADKQLALHEKEQALTQLNDSYAKQSETLRDSLLSQARRLVESRPTGYKQKVASLLQKAASEATKDESLEEYRRLAVACLGDPAALAPIELYSVNDAAVENGGRIAQMEMTADGSSLVLGLSNGALLMFSDLHAILQSGRPAPPRTLTANVEGANGERFRGRKLSFVNDSLLLEAVNLLSLIDGEENIGRFRFWRRVGGEWRPGTWHEADGAIGGVSMVGDRLVFAHLSSAPTLWDISDPIAPARESLPASITGDPAVDGRVVMRARLHPLGKLIALKVGDEKGVAHVEIHRFDGEGPPKILDVAETARIDWDKGGGWLTACSNNDVAVFEIPNPDDPAAIPDGPRNCIKGDTVISAEFAPDGRTLVYPCWQRNQVKLWDVIGNQIVGTLEHPGRPNRAHLTADGSMLATVSSDHVRLWRLQLPERRSLFGHREGATGLAYSPDGTLLASSGADHHVRIWDPTSGALLQELPGGGQGLAFSTDGRRLAAGGHASSVVRIYDTADWHELTQFDAELEEKIWALRFCGQDSRYLAVAGSSGLRIFPFSLDTGSINPQPVFESVVEKTANARSDVGQVTHLDGNASLLLWGAEQGRVYGASRLLHTYNLGNRATHTLRERAGGLYGFAVLPGNELVFSNRREGTIDRVPLNEEGMVAPGTAPSVLFDRQQLGTKQGSIAHDLLAHQQRPWLAIHLENEQKTEIWNWRTKRRLLTLPNRGAMIWDLQWHPRLPQLAVARSSGVVEIWDIDVMLQEGERLGF